MSVISASSRLAHRICTTVARAEDLFERCGLPLTRNVVVEVLAQPEGPEPLGHFGLRSDRIRLMAPADLSDALDERSAYRQIPAEEFFESIVVHELAHASFSASSCGWETCLAGHEYVAFAMQFEMLPSSVRNTLLAALPSTAAVELSWFTEDQLLEDPEDFAANAWRHFTRPETGCGFVRAIVTGEVVFPSEHE